MAAPAIVFAITIASNIGKNIALRLGVKALSLAFKAGGVKGFLVALTKLVVTAFVKAFTFIAAMQFIFGAVRFLYTFNWNMSDQAIDARIRGNLLALAGMAGGAVGQTLGWIVCGGLGSAVVAKINPLALASVTAAVTEEAVDEVVGAWVALLRNTFIKLTHNVFLWGFKTVRSLLKEVFRPLFGSKVDDWGKKGGPIISAAKIVNDVIESLPDGIEQFIEEAWEETWESCAEAFFVIAGTMDNFRAQTNIQRQQIIGTDRVIEVMPNREILTERYVLAGPTEIVKAQAVQLITNEQFMRSKDVGVVFSDTVDDRVLKRIPPTTGWEAHIQFYNLPMGKAPIPRRGKISGNYKIPDFNVLYLNDFDRIKRLAGTGGTNGYLNGIYRMSAELSNNGQMQVWCDSEASGKELVNNLLQLSDNVTVRRFTPGHKTDGGNIPATEISLSNERMYPYSILFIRHKRSSDPNVGKIRSYDGQRVEILKQKLFLWPDQKPSNWDALVAQMMID
ncbi:hypothetical protein NG798_23090 [Ancylothrix sp. C2]|uniref:hypothetical protein n=1 Tax=Ancylothrix sp. D3o TaxID=2953691 RepID=UPI0021BAF925|nr:hypothetical protein [Ancylothrix sp. D3o]MCT7952689.1 hypothetical protein [Ancylothrix sp. D3o]